MTTEVVCCTRKFVVFPLKARWESLDFRVKGKSPSHLTKSKYYTAMGKVNNDEFMQ